MPFSRGRVVPFRSGACFLSSWESAAPLRLHFNEMGAGAGLFSFARAMVQGFDPRGRSLSLSLSLACLLACQGDTSPGPRPNPKVCVSAMSGPFSGTRVRSPGCATCNQDPQNTPPSVSLSLSLFLSFPRLEGTPPAGAAHHGFTCERTLALHGRSF